MSTKRKPTTDPLRLEAFTPQDLINLLPYVRLASICHTAELGTRDGPFGSDVRLPRMLEGELHNILISDTVPVVRGVPDGWERRVLKYVIAELVKLGWSEEKFDSFVHGCKVKRSAKERQQKEAKKESANARKATQTQTAAGELGERYKLIRKADAYYDVQIRDLLRKSLVHQIAEHHCPIGIKPGYVLSLIEDNIYDRLGYGVGKPDTFIDGDGLKCLNTYRPGTLEPMEGDASQWVYHVSYIFNDGKDSGERDHFLAWLAHKVQYPAVKILHGVVIGNTKEGVGRGTLAMPLDAIFGRQNVVRPENNELLKGETCFLEGKLMVVVNELKAGDKQTVADIMKPVISEETIRVRRLFMNSFDVENPASVLAFTNFMQALHLYEYDRRWFIYNSSASPKHEQYYEELRAWLKGDGAAIVYNYLNKLDVAGFKPGAHPPMTTGKRQTIQASRGHNKQRVVVAFEDGKPPFARDLIILSNATDYLQNEGGLSKLTDNWLGTILRECGAEPMQENAVRYLRNEKECRDRIWVIRNVEKWRSVQQSIASRNGKGFAARLAKAIIGRVVWGIGRDVPINLASDDDAPTPTPDTATAREMSAEMDAHKAKANGFDGDRAERLKRVPPDQLKAGLANQASITH